MLPEECNASLRMRLRECHGLYEDCAEKHDDKEFLQLPGQVARCGHQAKNPYDMIWYDMRVHFLLL